MGSAKHSCSITAQLLHYIVTIATQPTRNRKAWLCYPPGDEETGE